MVVSENESLRLLLIEQSIHKEFIEVEFEKDRGKILTS